MKKQYPQQLTIFNILDKQPTKKKSNNVFKISAFEKRVEEKKRKAALERIAAYAKTLDWQEEM